FQLSYAPPSKNVGLKDFKGVGGRFQHLKGSASSLIGLDSLKISLKADLASRMQFAGKRSEDCAMKTSRVRISLKTVGRYLPPFKRRFGRLPGTVGRVVADRITASDSARYSPVSIRRRRFS